MIFFFLSVLFGCAFIFRDDLRGLLFFFFLTVGVLLERDYSNVLMSEGIKSWSNQFKIIHSHIEAKQNRADIHYAMNQQSSMKA